MALGARFAAALAVAALVSLVGLALIASRTIPSELEEGWPYGYDGYP